MFTLTIVDGFADPSPTRDSNACRRIVGRGLAIGVLSRATRTGDADDDVGVGR
jgi:hypothetical protein